MKKGKLRQGYKLPFQTITVEGREYKDYSFKYKGKIIEINIEKETGALYIFTP